MTTLVEGYGAPSPDREKSLCSRLMTCQWKKSVQDIHGEVLCGTKGIIFFTQAL
jgi:hypothetical protein